MQTLSIKQPWAWLIANGYKDIENRDWRTNARGRFLIHASQSIDKGAYDYIYKSIPVAGIIEKLPPIGSLQKGGIIGEAKIVDCVDKSESPWFGGRYGFVIEDAKPLPFMPCRGQLKFFETNYESGDNMAKEKTEEMTKREEVLIIPVPLTKEELSETMDGLCNGLKEIDKLTDELSEIKGDYGKRIKKISKEVTRLRRNYEEKTAEQEIECIIEFHWSKDVKRIINKKTNKKIREDKITAEDRQEKMDLDTHGTPLTDAGNTDNEPDVLEIKDDGHRAVEVKNGEKFIEIPFAGLKEGNTFRLVGKGKLIEINGKTEFNAIADPEKDEEGFWKISVV